MAIGVFFLFFPLPYAPVPIFVICGINLYVRSAFFSAAVCACVCCFWGRGTKAEGRQKLLTQLTLFLEH